MTQKVVLLRSYDWFCPSCQRQNFIHGRGEQFTAPDTVYCQHCTEGREGFSTTVHKIPRKKKDKP